MKKRTTASFGVRWGASAAAGGEKTAKQEQRQREWQQRSADGRNSSGERLRKTDWRTEEGEKKES